MNDIGTFTKRLGEVGTLREAGKYDAALARVEEMLKRWPANAHLHVLLAKLVQLSDEPTRTLDDAKRALQHAAELDARSPAAAIELGYFLDNVEDNPQAAAKAFAQGVSAARHLLIDALLGHTAALIQLDKRDEAVRSLLDALHLADADRSSRKEPFTTRIDELLVELGQMQSA